MPKRLGRGYACLRRGAEAKHRPAPAARSRSSSPTSGRCRASPACAPASGRTSTASAPSDALTVLVELPGVDPEKVDLFVAEGTLYLAGERARPRGAGQVYQQMEIDYGPFRRQIALGADVDVAQARATYEQRMLTIVLPLAQRPRRGERVVIAVTRA